MKKTAEGGIRALCLTAELECQSSPALCFSKLSWVCSLREADGETLKLHNHVGQSLIINYIYLCIYILLILFL